MSFRTWLSTKINRLTQNQEWVAFLGVDMVLTPAAFGFLFFSDLVSDQTKFCLVLFALSAIAAVASNYFGLPKVKLGAYGRQAVLATGKFAAAATFGMVTLCQVFQIPVAIVDVLDFGMLLFLCSVASRYIMLSVLRWVLHEGRARRRVLIYGAGETGLQIALALRSHRQIVPIAFLDDDVCLQAMTVSGLPVLSPARLDNIVRDLSPDRVVLAMPSLSPAKILRIIRKLKDSGLAVQALPSFAPIVGTEVANSSVHPAATGQYLGRSAFSDSFAEVSTTYADRVILVSGAGGSVGSELCRQLMVHLPKMLVLFEQSEIALYNIDRELRDLAFANCVEIIPVLGSVADGGLVQRTMVKTKTEVVFHAAAYKHVPLIEANPVAGLANNVLGTRVFAEAAMAASVNRFVFVSTDKAVRPVGVMGATKRLAELVIHDLAHRPSQTFFSTVRFGNVLGSSGSVLPLFREQIARGGPVTLTHEHVTRYFMTLAEAAQLVLVAGTICQTASLSDILVLDMGKPIKIRVLAERMINAEGLTLLTDANPDGDIEIVVTGLRPGEKLHEEVLLDGPMLPTPHPKILRAQATGLSEFAMASALRATVAAVQDSDQVAARRVLSTWVEGFPGQMTAVNAHPTDKAG